MNRGSANITEYDDDLPGVGPRVAHRANPAEPKNENQSYRKTTPSKFKLPASLGSSFFWGGGRAFDREITVLHIAPWECCEALFLGAERLLKRQGTLILYGPFKQKQRHTAPSNETFDARLKAEDPRWGVRDLEAVIEVAKKRHFHCSQLISMPANNLSLVFQRI